jgi:glycosyltransferase involved in cell wall biosynthesis
VGDWPFVSITLPVYNEEATIRATLESILAIDYPPEKRQILVISDCSSDRTDEIVREFADRGVEAIRLPTRAGKTAGENAGRQHLRGEILVNTDASVRVQRDALKPLIAQFADPSVGVASGRDVSVSRVDDNANLGESGYVGYEMWVRDLETRVGTIVGASGCFYATRMALHMEEVPDALSRDFAAPLIAREHGYRSVSVNAALCLVPRSGSLQQEYRRKVRTMARGLETLFYKRQLLNPVRYGMFAWMLASHKLARWLVPWGMLLAAIAVGMLAVTEPWARWLMGAGMAAGILALLGWHWPTARAMPKLVAAPTYVLSGTLAGLQAWMQALRGNRNPAWEPTRRAPVDARS